MSTHDTQWMASAACASRLDLPWTLDAAHVTPWHAATMRAICADCPALFNCLNAVDNLDVTGGWWAGHDRDPHADVSHLNPPDFAGSAGEPMSATPAPAATAPAGREPVMCWFPRTRRGRVFEQGAYVMQRDDDGAWHLGGVA